jgi:hypothetical protein
VTLVRHALLVGLAALVFAGGCEAEPASEGALDATLRTHAVEPSTPSAAGLAYIETMAGVHARSEEADPAARVSILREGLAVPVPAGLAEAEILRLDLAAALAESLVDQPEGAQVAIDLLEPMLPVSRSLPLDRATARALVALGDAAAQVGDDALAVGSYARAIRLMSLLRQELEP